MASSRIRLSTVFVFIAVIAAVLAFWRLKPQNDFIGIIPFEFLVALLAIVLATFAIMLLSFRQR